MDRERMEAYYRAFNSGDHEALVDFYAEDIVFEYQNTKLEGREVLLDHFAQLQQGFTEKMRPLSILVDGNRIAAEVEDTFTAKVDLPDFLGQSLKQGESVTAKYGCFYDTRSQKISHIRLYSFQ
jgi:ketosteroid isomerase-like protein